MTIKMTPHMKLKTVKKDETRSMDVCSVNTCKQVEGLTIYAPGIAFPEDRGHVALCDNHIKALDEMHAEAVARPDDKTEPLATPEPKELDLKAEAKEGAEVLEMVKAFEIVQQSDMDFANECVGEIKSKLKFYKEKKEEVSKPLNLALKNLRAQYAPVEDFYTQSEKIWKAKIAAFIQVQQEAQRQDLLAVQAAHRAGDVQAVAQAMTRAVQADVVLPTNVSVTKRWKHEVVDSSLVPEAYLMIVVDVSKIQATIEAADGAVEIPGVRIFRDDIVTRRGS